MFFRAPPSWQRKLDRTSPPTPRNSLKTLASLLIPFEAPSQLSYNRKQKTTTGMTAASPPGLLRRELLAQSLVQALAGRDFLQMGKAWALG